MPKPVKLKGPSGFYATMPDPTEPGLIVPIENETIGRFGPRERSYARATYRIKFNRDYSLPKISPNHFTANQVTFAHLVGALQNPEVVTVGEPAYKKLYEQASWSDLTKLFSVKLPTPTSFFISAAEEIAAVYLEGEANLVKGTAALLARYDGLTEEIGNILLTIPDPTVKKNLTLNESLPENIRMMAYLSS